MVSFRLYANRHTSTQLFGIGVDKHLSSSSDRTRQVPRFIPHLKILRKETIHRFLSQRSTWSFLLPRSRPESR